MFPSTVRDRLFEEKKASPNQFQNELMNIGGDNDGAPNHSSPPIADLFPEATILFADLSGFTEWCSSREPVQVFTLLETLYGAFDKIAKRRGVFKIETIGDCYVAVCGLPQPRKNHAVAMVRFASDIRSSMNSLTKELELTLGPGTGDLLLRCGLHSGAVTAGVLRSANSRFQLFGDTVNTSARMESNGTPNRIHISQTTADLLIKAGKGQWLTKRDELIEAKGKGKMQTYWVEPGCGNAATSIQSGLESSGNGSSHE
jgi:class 3 adenylate cyclase